MFSVVIFQCDDSVAVIPNCWIKELAEDGSNGKCYWPSKNAARAASSSQPPQNEWKVFDIRILKAFESYSEAQKAIPRAEETSDLNDPTHEDPCKRHSRHTAPHSADVEQCQTPTNVNASYTRPVPPLFPKLTEMNSSDQIVAHEDESLASHVESQMLHGRLSTSSTATQRDISFDVEGPSRSRSPIKITKASRSKKLHGRLSTSSTATQRNSSSYIDGPSRSSDVPRSPPSAREVGSEHLATTALSQNSVRRNPLFKPEVATDLAIQKAAGAWFYNARDRAGGRLTRAKLLVKKNFRKE